MKSLLISWTAVRLALGEIESGNNDHLVGKAGEVSRFQITPGVWRKWDRGEPTNDPGKAWKVARQAIGCRATGFFVSTERNPTIQEIYVLWHRPGEFARCQWRIERMPRRVRERAKRFENLYNDYAAH